MMSLPDTPKHGRWDDCRSFHDQLLARSKLQEAGRRRPSGFGSLRKLGLLPASGGSGLAAWRPSRAEAGSIALQLVGVAALGLASALLYRDDPPVRWSALAAALGLVAFGLAPLARRLGGGRRASKGARRWVAAD